MNNVKQRITRVLITVGVMVVILLMVTMSFKFLTTSADLGLASVYGFGPARRHFKVGNGSRATVATDFNNDGKNDIAAVNYYDGTLSVLLGNGDGTFLNAVNYAVGTNPVDIFSADFSGDNKKDLIVVNSASGNVSVLLGNGDGTFQAAVNYAVGTTPNSVFGADFNADSKPDIVIANNGSSNVSVLLGNGDGTFQTVVNYALTANSTGAVAADLNGDSKNDIAAISASKIFILIGKGDGTFQNATSYNAPAGTPVAIFADDFNGDGKKELVTANYNNTSISVFPGNGDGTFVSYSTYSSTTAAPTSILSADFNGDGKKDIATVNAGSTATSAVSIFLGNGDNTFQSPVSYQVGWNPYGTMGAADFNGDTYLDLAVPHKGTDNRTYPAYTISILFGNGDGTFQSDARYATGTNPIWVDGADFNKDGNLDLITPNGGSSNASILLGVGDGTFQPAVNYAVGNQPFATAINDFNNDGKMDLAVSNRADNNISVLMGNGDGTFQTAINYTPATKPWQIAAADFNKDGKVDLVGGGSILLGNGDGTFQVSGSVSGGASANINNDDFLDVIGVSNNSVSVQLGNGNGTFQPAITTPSGGTDVRGVAVGDLNKDGKNDAIMDNFANDTVSVLLGNGNGTFNSAMNYDSGDGPSIPALVDFNGDGNLDIVNGNWFARDIALLAGNGDGTFQPPVFLGAGAGSSNTYAADVNSDGKKDLVINNFSANTVSVLLAANVKITESSNATTVFEGKGPDIYTVALATRPTSQVSIQITGDSQVQISPSSLTFTPASWNSPQEITVTAMNDGVEEASQTGTIRHAVTSTSDPTYKGVSLSNLVVTVGDSPLIFTHSIGSSTEVAETMTSNYTIALGVKPTANVTVAIQPNPQFTFTASAFTFTPSNWNIKQTVAVSGVDDKNANGNRNATILHKLSGDDPNFVDPVGIPFSVILKDKPAVPAGGTQATDTSAVGTSTVGTSTVGTTTVGTTTDTALIGTSSAGIVPLKVEFQDVPRTGTSTLGQKEVQAIYEVMQVVADNNLYEGPFKKDFGPFNKTTRYFAIQLALAVTGESCGQSVTYETCRNAALKLKLIESDELQTVFVTREQFYKLLLKAADITLLSRTSSKVKKNMPCRDVVSNSSSAALIATARLNGVGAVYPGNKCNLKLAMPKYAAVALVSKALAIKEKLRNQNQKKNTITK